MRTRGGLIAELGEHLDADPRDEPLDARGAWLLPGLWDTHIHLLLYALSLQKLDLSGCASREELLHSLAQRALLAQPGDWVEGQGWAEADWPDRRLPSLEELDRAAPENPVLLTRSDLHSALINSQTLRQAGIETSTPDPPGGCWERDLQGRFTGRAMDMALPILLEVLPRPTSASLARALEQTVARLHEWGIVGVCDQRLKDHPDGPQAWQSYPGLPLRIHCNLAFHDLATWTLPFGHGDDWLRVGHVKFFADGSMGSRTARLKQPYLGEIQRGLWLTPPNELREGFAQARRRGYPISVHAIGDEAISEVLAAFSDLPAHPLDRIEHLQILDPQDLERVAKWGGWASMQPVHLLDDRNLADAILGERASNYYRLASLNRRGVPLAFGSDAPVASADPWLGMRAAIERRRAAGESPWYPAECLSSYAALQAYTSQATASLGWSHTGVLRAGNWADWILVDGDPLQGPVQVLRTVVGGKTVFQRAL